MNNLKRNVTFEKHGSTRHIWTTIIVTLFNCQGDLRYVELLDFIFINASPKNKAKNKIRPYRKYCNINDSDDQDKCIGKSEPGDFPELHLFFVGSLFKEAVITADAKRILIGSDIFNAILAYIGFYYVFYIGYKIQIKDFLGFLQETLLQEKFETKPIPMGFTEQMHRVRKLEKLRQIENDEKNSVPDVGCHVRAGVGVGDQDSQDSQMDELSEEF